MGVVIVILLHSSVGILRPHRKGSGLRPLLADVKSPWRVLDFSEFFFGEWVAMQWYVGQSHCCYGHKAKNQKQAIDGCLRIRGTGREVKKCVCSRQCKTNG
jgi:hypothetical protein